MAYTGVEWEDAPSLKTPLTAANLNKMDQAIVQNSENIEKLAPKKYNARLLAGDTNITFSGFSIAADTKLDLYCQDMLIGPKEVKTYATSVVYTFDAQEKDLIFTLEVIG